MLSVFVCICCVLYVLCMFEVFCDHLWCILCLCDMYCFCVFVCDVLFVVSWGFLHMCCV